MVSKRGFLPGGEERVQWIFEGEAWDEEMMQPLLEVVADHVRDIRTRFGFDVTNYFEFSYSDLEGIGRIFYARRCQWRYLLQAFSPGELAEKVQKNISR